MTRLTEQELDLIQNSRRAGAPAAAHENPLVAALKGAWTQFVHGIRQARLRRGATRDLQRLNDHLLRDIGLERMEIETCAAQMAAGQVPAPAAVPSLRARFRRWRQRRATIAQLESLDARLLADIGLVRGDIPAVATQMAATDTVAHEEATYWNAVFQGLRRWNLSRRAAGQMARLGADTLSDLGYVKGDVDWVPEVLAERRLSKKKAA